MNRRRFNIQCAALLPSFASVGFANESRFDITRYGAKEGGLKKCTGAIRDAIAACHGAGGGRVVVPAGRFLTGAIHLDSNVQLYLAEGSTLLFSQDPSDYLPVVFTRFEGTECMNYSPFIYAFEKSNIGVTGPGTLDGQASETAWWHWTSAAKADRQTLLAMGERGVPVEQRIFGAGHYLRPTFIQPYRCKTVLLEGFIIKNSPMWELNPVLCRDVVVRKVNVASHGPNNDGCDPESCDGVLIDACTFSTGDDCIAVKSGRNADGRRVNVPCQNVRIQNCVMQDGHGGVSIGSEVSGGIRNILTTNCEMSSPHLQRALRIKSNSYRGGVIENIQFYKVNVGSVEQAAIEVDFFYEEGVGGPFLPVVRGVDVAQVTCNRSKHAIFMRGFPNDPITGVNISNSTFSNASEGVLFQDVKEIGLDHVLINGRPFTAADIKTRS